MADIDYTRHYRNWHSDDESHINNMTSYYSKRIIPVFPQDKGIKILDIGCGMGFLMMALEQNGFANVNGIDIDEGQVKSCQSKGLKVELVKDTIQYLNDHASHFELITAFDVLEHVPVEVQIDFVSAVHKALKDGGKFICSVPNANSLLGNRNRYIDYTHWVTFTEISLDFVLYNGGFKKIDIKAMDFVFFSIKPTQLIHFLLFKINRWLRKLSFIAELGIKQGSSVPLSFNLLGIAQKD